MTQLVLNPYISPNSLLRTSHLENKQAKVLREKTVNTCLAHLAHKMNKGGKFWKGNIIVFHDRSFPEAAIMTSYIFFLQRQGS